MQYITRTIDGIDGSKAHFIGYVLDNSPEIDETRRRPAVLIIPGGGYIMTSDRESEPIAMKFAEAGYQAFILRYSCEPSRYPTSLLEAAEAMRLIHEHADEWHINTSHIAVIGFSAGGHLAANLATTTGDDDLTAAGYDPDDVRPDALMLVYPVITGGKFAHRPSFDALLGPDRKDDPTWLDKLSIEKHIDKKTPPVFVWHTMTDATVPVENTLLLIQACHAANISIETHLFPEGRHGVALGNWETSWHKDPVGTIVPCVQIWPQLAIAWLQRTFA